VGTANSMRTLRTAFAPVLAALALAPAASASNCSQADANPDEISVNDYSATLLCVVNEERRDWGRPGLVPQRNLARAAGSHASDMATQRYFSHTARDGDTLADRLDQANFIPSSDRWRAGENLAAGEGPMGSPAAIVSGWMNSREHRRNLLDPGYTMAGIGVARGWPAPGSDQNQAVTIDLDLGWRALSRRR
jgi:uncharacterized protein YkwD